jgi:hypothetical protein
MTEVTIFVAAEDALKIELRAQGEAHALLDVLCIEAVSPDKETEIKKAMLRVASFAILCHSGQLKDHTNVSFPA